MTTRISSAMMTKFALDAMLRQQGELSNTQLQITTGKRILAPSDDPYGSARAINLQESTAITNQYQVNIQYADNRLGEEEGLLQGIMTALQRVREMAVYANNDSQTVETRRYIREEILLLKDQVVSLANATDSNNEYVFSGYKGKSRPFSYDLSLNDYVYNGDDGKRELKIGTTTKIEVNDDGQDVFMEVRDGNGRFSVWEDPANQGTGIIDPGAVVGTYVPDTYQVKFMPSTSALPNQPVEYYVTNSKGQVIISGSGVAPPGGFLYANEAAYFAAILAATDTGVVYQDSEIIGLEQYGIQTSISGEPTATGPITAVGPATQDTFTIKPSNYQNIFKTIKNLEDALVSEQATDAERTHFHSAMNRVIVDIDQAIGSVLDTRARVGARMNTVQKQKEINESFNLQLRQVLSQIEDLDYAEAITRLNMQLTALDASQNTYKKVSELSLFNYL
ncbi:MAG: flagellar hook-associated protein FlgL [Gammaproteobacteria bacterium]|nr:flagellar hook-associated protein FlgL [Gammaproteobacteria bacterium]